MHRLWTGWAQVLQCSWKPISIVKHPHQSLIKTFSVSYQWQIHGYLDEHSTNLLVRVDRVYVSSGEKGSIFRVLLPIEREREGESAKKVFLFDVIRKSFQAEVQIPDGDATLTLTRKTAVEMKYGACDAHGSSTINRYTIYIYNPINIQRESRCCLHACSIQVTENGLRPLVRRYWCSKLVEMFRANHKINARAVRREARAILY